MLKLQGISSLVINSLRPYRTDRPIVIGSDLDGSSIILVLINPYGKVLASEGKRNKEADTPNIDVIKLCPDVLNSVMKNPFITLFEALSGRGLRPIRLNFYSNFLLTFLRSMPYEN